MNPVPMMKLVEGHQWLRYQQGGDPACARFVQRPRQVPVSVNDYGLCGQSDLDADDQYLV